MATSVPVLTWVKKGIGGRLLGTFEFTDLYGKGAEGEIYWINDPEFVGLRYPDNGRLAPGAGWLHWRSREIQLAFEEEKSKWEKLHGITKTTPEAPPLKLKLRVEEPLAKPKLILKGNKPKLILNPKKEPQLRLKK